MKRTLIAASFLALAAPALADDQRAADECIAAWGSKSPFKKGKRPDIVIGTGVKVFGLGKGQANDTVTDSPRLVVVHPAVNVAGKSTVRLGNPTAGIACATRPRWPARSRSSRTARRSWRTRATAARRCSRPTTPTRAWR